jgi:hypothetical protein
MWVMCGPYSGVCLLQLDVVGACGGVVMVIGGVSFCPVGSSSCGSGVMCVDSSVWCVSVGASRVVFDGGVVAVGWEFVGGDVVGCGLLEDGDEVSSAGGAGGGYDSVGVP